MGYPDPNGGKPRPEQGSAPVWEPDAVTSFADAGTPEAEAELETCLAFLRALHAKGAERAERFQYGTAYLCDSLPRIYSLTFLELDRGAEPAAADLVAECDRLLAGFGHRRVRTDDDAVGTRLEPELRSLGWKIEPLLVMSHRQSDPSVDTTSTREVDFETLVPLWQEGSRDAGLDEEVVRQIVGQRRGDGAAGRARYFAAERGRRDCELLRALHGRRSRTDRGCADALPVQEPRAGERRRRAGAGRVTRGRAREDVPPRRGERLAARALPEAWLRRVGRIWDFLLAD